MGAATAADYFGARLRELREAAGYTQGGLAERAGLSQNGIAQFEIGRRKPSWETVLVLAEALGVGVEAFVVPPASTEKRRPGRRPAVQPVEEVLPKRGRPPKKSE